MRRKTLLPDSFAIGLLLFGIVLFLFPLFRMAGIIALLASVAYWLIILGLNAARNKRR